MFSLKTKCVILLLFCLSVYSKGSDYTVYIIDTKNLKNIDETIKSGGYKKEFVYLLGLPFQEPSNKFFMGSMKTNIYAHWTLREKELTVSLEIREVSGKDTLYIGIFKLPENNEKAIYKEKEGYVMILERNKK